MDIQRPDLAEKRKKKRIRNGLIAAGAVLLVTLGLSRLKPAAPTVERATVLVDTVKRGELLRQVRGLGTLVPEEIRWIPAQRGRVERIVLQPGTEVKPDTVILELSNPELELQALDAESQLRAAEAQYDELKVRLESQHLDQEAAAARVQAEYQQAKLRADADEELAQQGLIADLTLQALAQRRRRARQPQPASSRSGWRSPARRSRRSSPCSAPRWSSAGRWPACGAARSRPCRCGPGIDGRAAAGAGRGRASR